MAGRRGPRPKLTPELIARIEELVAEGVPKRWIADDIGMSYYIVRAYLINRADAQVNERQFNQVWTAIRPNPTLLKWHAMFAPSSEKI